MIAHPVRTLPVLIALPAFSAAIHSQDAPDSRAGSRPAGRFEFADMKHDFGRIHDDHPVDWRFPFTNRAAFAVTIDARTSCGCTTWKIVPDKKTFGPAESGELVATYNPMNRQAKELKIVTVKTDEPGAKPINLELDVYVIPRIGIDYPAISFGEVRFDALEATPVKKDVTITSRVPTFQIKSARASDPRFVLTELPPKQGQADGDPVTFYKYEISLASNLPIGRLQTELRIETNDPLKAVIPVPLIVEAFGAFRVFPQPLGLQLATPAVPVDAFVTLSSRDAKPFHVSEATVVGSDTMALKTLVEPIAPKSEIGYRVHVLGTAPEGGTRISGTLKIKTDNATEPEVNVPITGYVLRASQQ